MRVTFYIFFFAFEIFYRCMGLNFIDLPGFGSDEKTEDVILVKSDKEGKPPAKVEPHLAPDKMKQKKEQTPNARRFFDDRKEYDFYDFNKPTTPDKPIISSKPRISYKGKLPTKVETNLAPDKIMQKKEQIPNGRRFFDDAKEYEYDFEKPITPVKPGKPRLSYETGAWKPRLHPRVPSSTVTMSTAHRRNWLVSATQGESSTHGQDKDENIKSKIGMLVQQTMHDAENKLNSIQKLKDKHRGEAPYRIGFILSMIKKSRDVLNELFNVAVKHRDEWKALEQLKIFELIVHTNVDTTNLVRQLVEIHIQNLNSTSQEEQQHQEQQENKPRLLLRNIGGR